VILCQEKDAIEYCGGTPADRDSFWTDAGNAVKRPTHAIPLFELCRAIHFGATRGTMEPAVFRRCWDDLSERHEQRCAEGNLLHLLGSGDTPDGLLKDILLLGPEPPRNIPVRTEAEDDRDRVRDHQGLTERFRRLHERAWHLTLRWKDERLRWKTTPPESMPSLEMPSKGTLPGLVLDTNVALEVFNKLPRDGVWAGQLSLPDRLKRASASMVREIQRLVAGRGAPGKLIIPASVLVEMKRVTQREPEQYAPSALVLQRMAFANHWPLRNSFLFEPLSVEVFNAFLHLHEVLAAARIPAERWPQLGDALVMAHGLYNRCRVASTEWHEGRARKLDWEAVRHIFPFLLPD
jgi:hypothetical protein